MTAAFWWYLLAGFILGFCLSTAWEWLYFRQRRMRIADRRIAALQQQLDSQMRAARPDIPSEPGVTWTATEYQSPGILLENETDAQPAPRAAVPVTAAVLRADQANGQRGARQSIQRPPGRAPRAVQTAGAAQTADAAPSPATAAAEAAAALVHARHRGSAERTPPQQPADAAAASPTREHRAAQAAAAAALLAHARGSGRTRSGTGRSAPPPDRPSDRAAQPAAAAALLSHAGAADEPTAAQTAAQPPDGEHRGAEAAAAAALLVPRRGQRTNP
jgi:hypothetical protein